MRLFHKILLLVLTLSVVPLACVGYKAMTGLREEIRGDVQAMYRERVAANRDRIAGFVEDVNARVMQAAHFQDLGRMDAGRMREFCRDLVRQFGEVDAASVLDDIGGELASAVEAEGFSPQRLLAHLATLERGRLEQAYRTRGGISPAYLAGGAPFVTVYAPVVFADRPAPGLLAYSLSLAAVQERVEGIEFSKSDRGAALLLDDDGTLIAGKMKGRAREELRAFAGLPLVARARANRASLAASTEEFTDPFGTAQTGAFAFLDKTGWLLLICEPTDRVFASADLLRDRVAGIVLLTVLASALAGLFFARRLVRPLSALVHGAAQIGAGNLDFRIERLSGDEIGGLCDAFSHMGLSLKRRETTIARIREVAVELNTSFERARVFEAGARALAELAGAREVRLYAPRADGALRQEFRHGPGAAFRDEGMAAELAGLDAARRLEGARWDGDGDAARLATLLVPLSVNDPKQGRVLKGCLVLGGAEFSPLDLEVSQILAGAMVVSFMNIEFVSASVQNERRAHELEIAELVQRTLYPEKDPELPELEIHSFIQSSSETGGDWYGYLRSDDGSRLTVLIGDVTGHGAPAALVTAAANAFFKTMESMQELLRANPGRLDLDLHSPRFLLGLLNRVILETAHGRLVMTFFISTIDLRTGRMRSANAGHNPPWIWRRDGAAAERAAAALERARQEEEAKAAPASVVAPAAAAPAAKPAGKLKILGRVAGQKAAPAATPPAPDPAPPVPEAAPPAPSAETAPAAAEPAKPAKPKLKIVGKVAGQKPAAAEPAAPDGAPAPGAAPAPAWEAINMRGMRLGETVTQDFQEKETVLLAGDVVVWFTDGFIENGNAAGEEFGRARMRAALEESFAEGMPAAMKNLCRRSYDFYGDHPRGDDLTAVLCRVRKDWQAAPPPEPPPAAPAG